ncbi:MAG: hypothetical protein QOE93_790, partial [Actinomycetota bacterium]|nr:hypothetical protein [Actinomycetota bacterium]
PHDDANCPNMGGQSDGTGTGGAAADGAVFRGGRGPRGGATTQSL